jgi:HEAT repeat protein
MVSQQIDEIFGQTLAGDYDDESPWEAVRRLHIIGSREVFDRAAEWCSSDNPLKRGRGADVLAQLGKSPDHPEHNFPDECFAIVSSLVQKEQDPLALMSAVYALGHIGNPLAIPLVTELHLHPSADVRCAAAYSLGSFANDSRAADALLELLRDVDEEVRDWSTFGLGVLGDLDSPEVRDALYQRMTDSSRDVREEALVGLAKRKDRRVLPTLVAKLNEPEISIRVTDAAEAFLEEGEDRRDWSPSDYVAALKNCFSL